MRVLAFVPALGVVSETFIADALEGLAQTTELVVATGQAGDAARVPSGAGFVAAPFLHLSRKGERFAARLSRAPLWSTKRDTPLDHNAARVVGDLITRIDPSVAYLEYGTTLARLAKPLARAGVPAIVHLHGHDVTAALADPAYRAALAAGLGEVAGVAVASHHMRRLAILAGAAPELVHVVPLGICPQGLEPMPWAERAAAPPRIVFLGRLVAKKHPVALIEAFAIIAAARPDATLDIIGDGPERAAAEARAAARGVAGKVSFHGALPRGEALAIVRRCRIYAQHSVTAFTGDQEGFGISIAEAAALELAVVATHHNGIPEQVSDGQTGLLVPEYDFEAMAAAILSLIKDPDRCAALGREGRARVFSTYPPAARIERLTILLSAAAGQPQRR
ncbi:glycosyltransferase [Acuticoccus sp. I52.16.1]|uniref:glycosyltransferase n=1 Tax=Acuticoccus sp. I52.16.1 TaxID=2928472 RepID=UPI001FD0292B|nr:glycosyltransferase [Acuticoccus sp. I52.16.1]UOM36773.1 glycosyltransferase [Acuticoccus sp. I52.16.1]